MSKKRRKILADKQFGEVKHYSKKYAATVLSVISAVLLVATIVGAILLREYIDDLEAFAKENMFVGSIIFSVVCAVESPSEHLLFIIIKLFYTISPIFSTPKALHWRKFNIK